MKEFLHRVIKFAAYTAAGVVIMLAIAVALFRLFLPRLPEYQEDIKSWASAAIGMRVEFTNMDARWGLNGPELKFYSAELVRPQDDTRFVAAREVGIGVSLLRLLVDRKLVVDTVTVAETSVEVRRLADGGWRIQGSPAEELLALRGDGGGGMRALTVIGQDIEVQYIEPGDERPRFFEVSRFVADADDARLAIDATIRLPEEFGDELRVSATRLHPEFDQVEPWNVHVVADRVDLAGVSSVGSGALPVFASGSGELDLSMAVVGREVRSASAELDFENVALDSAPAFDLAGRLALANDADGWLVAADDLVLRSGNGEWPRSSLRLEASTDRQSEIVMFDARAGYLNLADLGSFAPLLGNAHREQLDRWRPDGVVRDLVATVSDLTGDSPRYSVTADVDRAGFAANGKLPGARGFTGSLRADHEGGLLEIRASGVTLDLPAWLTEPIAIDTADGTVIWRRGDERTTILSDSIAVRNSIFDSQSNIEVTLSAGAAPVVELSSSWRIDDLAAARRYMPESIMSPKLYLWVQDAFLAGRISRATTRLNGPLDKFPFDAGEGRLQIVADVEELEFRYARQFPPANVREMQVVMDNMRLYSVQNRYDSLGNSTVDGKIEIEDLRRPLLTVDSYSTGTLESLREFARNSPVDAVFGGQLSRLRVGGNADVRLNLAMPLKNWRAYEFTARIRSDDGTLEVEGLDPPITALTGTVTVERDRVSSESLGGRFLDEAISIELQNATPDLAQFRAVARISGGAGANELATAFGLPLDDRIAGWTEYHADILFPRSKLDDPAPLTLRVGTNLKGLSIDLPAPFLKTAESSRPLSFDVAFLKGERIQTKGEASDDFRWQLDFTKQNGAWDFDRGVLALGAEPMGTPEVRGLHIHGRTPRVRFDDWLAQARGDPGRSGVAERIRSIDLEIDDLYLLGQHLVGHRVRVDRSARDWLVQFDGADVTGSAFVPYDFSAGRALVLDMERLVLPGDDAAEEKTGSPLDPRRLPAISLDAGEFAIGERFFGAVEAEFVNTPEGLESNGIVAKDASFEIVADGRWVYAEDDPMGSRTHLRATLTSSDVVATMRRLNYNPGIVSDDMGIVADVYWSGGPRLDFLGTLTGNVQVRLGSGQLDEVEPGAGRMFGLMSIVALPRRLSLDFRDVFQRGFGFDSIGGSFRIEDGTAYTCNLSLEGPAASIGIIGEADLANRDYAQTAVVSANVGNTLPVVGALAAGPQVAAALFLFSQIFKKPLQDIGQVYYGISGPWDAPEVETTNAAAFAQSGELAGCLDESG